MPHARGARLRGVALLALGAVLSLGFLASTMHWTVLAGASLVLVGLGWLTSAALPPPLRLPLRALAWAATATYYAALIALATVFGVALAWAVPLWAVALVGVLAACSLWSVRPGRRGAGLPLSVALGAWILLCAVAWKREDGLVRCEDYLRVAADRSLALVIPSAPALRGCEPGQRMALLRYPRFVQEIPDGRGFLFTTQPGSAHTWNPGVTTTGDLDGSICIAGPDGARPQCGGHGTAQGIFEAPDLGRVFVAIYTRPATLIELPWPGELRFLRELPLEETPADGFYDRPSQTLYLYADDARAIHPVDAVKMTALPRIAGPMTGGQASWYPDRREGVICGGHGPFLPVAGERYFAVAVRAGPFGFRPLGGDHPWSLVGLSWGCDFDPDERRVYSALVLGRLAVVDYDSGKALAMHRIGLARRAVALDRARRRLYTASFFSGAVQALELDTFREVGRWFPGRFVRRLVLSSDGRSLLATSNLGVVRIPLGDEPMPAADRPGEAR